MIILGIESSCDETAASIVNDQKEILSHIVFSQIDHEKFGGVVPELAARAHVDKLPEIVKLALDQANLKYSDLDAIAVTAGPGLIGGLLVGVMMVKAMCSVLKIPLIAVNHLEGHALTARLTNEVNFPYLLLLISGGHCQILAVENIGEYKKFGSTIDDSLGEAFDKVAKMMGLGYPGGPIMEKIAVHGNENRFILPIPMAGREGCDFSFSGLKTAVRREIEKLNFELTEQDKADMSASFHFTVAKILKNRLKNAFAQFTKLYPENKELIIAGGVAANRYLFKELNEFAKSYNYTIITPPVNLCTDNAAMIAWAGIEKFKKKQFANLDIQPQASWPLV